MTDLITAALSFAITAVGVGVFRHWGIKKQLLDIPNERSSHESPTPRGGGLIIVIVCTIWLAASSYLQQTSIFAAIIIGGLMIAAVSWLDDLFEVKVGWRLLVHSAAVLLAINYVGSFESVRLPGMVLPLETGMFGPVLTFLWVVWVINAYNFMDGIDGIAGSQALTAAAGWATVAWIFGMPGTLFLSVLIAGASAGFLVHNWPPAKVFMGDVGSAFLGFALGVMPLVAARELPEQAPQFVFFGVAVLWLFIFDSVLTFLRRLLRGERFWRAHREHLYQRMVIGGLSHRSVTTFYTIAAILITAAAILWIVNGGIFRLLIVFLLVGSSAGLLLMARNQRRS